jgi:hypothetical protein
MKTRGSFIAKNWLKIILNLLAVIILTCLCRFIFLTMKYVFLNQASSTLGNILAFAPTWRSPEKAKGGMFTHGVKNGDKGAHASGENRTWDGYNRGSRSDIMRFQWKCAGRSAHLALQR